MKASLEAGGSHFDQALNALMLLSYVALKEGDEVGAMTFGNPSGQRRESRRARARPRSTLLMNQLHDIEPEATHSDYLAAAQELMRLHPKRALVIMLTNFRDEDAPELRTARCGCCGSATWYWSRACVSACSGNWQASRSARRNAMSK